MVNRLGDGSVPPPQADDRTRTLAAQIMLRQPTVQFKVLADGNIQFHLPLTGYAVSPSQLMQARLLRTRWFANAIGEYVVRINLERLDEVIRRPDYPELVGKTRHSGFGLSISPTNLFFQFHCSLLNKLFNEQMRWELKGVNG